MGWGERTGRRFDGGRVVADIRKRRRVVNLVGYPCRHSWAICPAASDAQVRAMATVIPIALTVAACQPPDAAQIALSTSARALAEIDQVVAGIFASAHAEALEDSETREEYDAAMRPMFRAEEGLRIARASLISSQAALDAWDAAGEESSFRATLPALLGSLETMLQSLRDIAAPIPEDLIEGVRLVRALLGGAS